MDKLLTLNDKLQDSAHLQALEGNPLAAGEIAMFEMFEREGWSADERHAHILAQLSVPVLSAE